MASAVSARTGGTGSAARPGGGRGPRSRPCRGAGCRGRRGRAATAATRSSASAPVGASSTRETAAPRGTPRGSSGSRRRPRRGGSGPASRVPGAGSRSRGGSRARSGAAPRRPPPGQDDAEQAPLPRLALDLHPPAVQLGEAPHEREAEARPGVLAREPRVELREGLEELREVLCRDPGPGVADLEPDEPGLLVARGRELHGPARRRELHRVREEVHEDLPDPPGVRDEADRRGRAAEREVDPLPSRLAPHDREGRLADLRERAGVRLESESLSAPILARSRMSERSARRCRPASSRKPRRPELPLVERAVDARRGGARRRRGFP